MSYEENPGAARPGAYPPDLVFWYEFASSYSYIAAFSVERAAAAANIRIEWRPFLLGPIFARQGWSNSPFNLYPVKGAYMWRDLERLAARAGLDWRRPALFPQNGLHAARIAVVGAAAPWGVPFAKAVFRANFALGQDIANPATLRAILADLGEPVDAVLAAAGTPAIKDRLRANTAEAERLGIFGAPTFQAGDELFWGQDRLDQAVEWAGRPRR